MQCVERSFVFLGFLLNSNECNLKFYKTTNAQRIIYLFDKNYLNEFKESNIRKRLFLVYRNDI